MIRFIFTVSLFVCLTPVFTYNQVHAEVTIELGERIAVTDKSECIKAIEKGKLINSQPYNGQDWETVINAYLYKGYIYFGKLTRSYFEMEAGKSKKELVCFFKRSLGN